MHIPEYTISPKLSAALERAFAPFLKQERNGEPLAYWLDAKFPSDNEYLPPTITIPLAHALDQALALEGGAEGAKLLEAMDGILNGGGNPALLIHGLPAEGEISPLLREAFRQKLFADTAKPFTVPLHIQDIVNPKDAKGFSESGHTALHQDDGDIGLLFGVAGGINPRNTMIRSLPQFIHDITTESESMGLAVPEDAVRRLLLLPIWPVHVTSPHKNQGSDRKNSTRLDDQREKKARQLNLLRVGQNGKAYAPILYPNPQYCNAQPDSQPYNMLETPFDNLDLRIQSPDMSEVPNDLKAHVEDFIQSLAFVRKNPIGARQGPILQAGDMLVYNNHQLLHAGGKYVHKQLSQEAMGDANRQPRHVISLDVVTQNPAIYPIRPNDRAIQPIQYDGKGFNINPDSLAR